MALCASDTPAKNLLTFFKIGLHTNVFYMGLVF